MNPVLHPATALEIQQFVGRPPHALMLVGSEGVGKTTIARHLASALLGIKELDKYPHFRIVSPDGQTISIEVIRELLHFTKLKIAGQGVRRIIVIDQAQAMTGEAQNALLKLLEEPPEGTVFLLTAPNAQDLLPTVRSRTQQLAIRQPSEPALEQYFATQGFTLQDVRSNLLLSGGLPGLMHALLQGSDSHPLVAAVEQSKQLLQASIFERLAMVDQLAKQKTDAVRVLFVLQQMAHAAMQQAAAKNSIGSLRRWHRILGAALEADEALAASAQPKLVLTNLMLTI